MAPADSAAASPEPEPFDFQTTSSPDASAGGPSAALSPDAAQLDAGDFNVSLLLPRAPLCFTIWY
jgi:hypothetical protein